MIIILLAQGTPKFLATQNWKNDKFGKFYDRVRQGPKQLYIR